MSGFIQLSNIETNQMVAHMVMTAGARMIIPVKKYVRNLPKSEVLLAGIKGLSVGKSLMTVDCNIVRFGARRFANGA